jgi:hypothetical protein
MALPYPHGRRLEVDHKNDQFSGVRPCLHGKMHATYLEKTNPPRQSYICGLVKRASAEADMICLEPPLWSIWQGHRSRIELQ